MSSKKKTTIKIEAFFKEQGVLFHALDVPPSLVYFFAKSKAIAACRSLSGYVYYAQYVQPGNLMYKHTPKTYSKARQCFKPQNRVPNNLEASLRTHT